MPRYDVIVAGGYFVDLIFNGLPQFPVLGKEIVGTGFEMLPGGAYNAALAMHRLGLKVAWAADFGNDDYSRFTVERAHAEGLDDALFVHHRRPLRRITVALSYPEERAFITYVDPEPSTPAALKALVAASARVLFISGVYYGSLYAAGSALVRAKRMKVFMDGNSDDEVTLDNPAVRRSLQSVDAFLPNAAEARRITGRSELCAAMSALAALCPQVIIKDGANGSYACTGAETVHAPGIAVTPVDTTGAGDCFSAGFLKAWFDNRPLVECLRWGNIVGGLSTTALGGTGRSVMPAEVERLAAKS
jgi:sugar/nucleoside kinase (ribokinase family)